MNIEEANRTYFRSVAAISALIDQRVYWEEAPGNASLPYITLHKVNGGRHSGIGFARPLMQASCWATGKYAALELAEAVIGAIRNYQGSMGSLWVSSSYSNDLIIRDPSGIWHAPVDYYIAHMED